MTTLPVATVHVRLVMSQTTGTVGKAFLQLKYTRSYRCSTGCPLMDYRLLQLLSQFCRHLPQAGV